MNSQAARVIVSEDRLTPLLRKHPDFDWPAKPVAAEEITAAQMRAIVEQWRTAVERTASLLRKHAMGNLEALPSGCLYEHLHRPDWKRAALACEVLRHPSLSKNSGWLDTRTLQARIAAAEPPIRLVIGWGQAKRDAAGLKTGGPFADLAEAYAISRLAIIAKAMSALLARAVQVVVQSGGQRFRPALFTDAALCRQYDAQRQRIADALGGAGTVLVRDYIDELTPRQREQRHLRYARIVDTISDDMVAAQFDTVLMNVDWLSVFEPRPAEPTAEFPLPPGIRDWLSGRSRDDLALLIRAALSSIITPRRQSDWQKKLNDTEDLIQDTVAFMRNVAWEATRRYIALHAADAELSERRDETSAAEAAIRLTVHQKSDRPDIPAIFTLGRGGGDLLSQHVAARVDGAGQPHFEPLAEVLTHRVRPVVVHAGPASGEVLFDWLEDVAQPLAFVEAAGRAACELIGGVLDH